MQRTPLACPACGKVNDRHAGSDPGARPEFGDIGMCWSCGAWAVFDADAFGQLTLRQPTDAEVAEIEQDRRMEVARFERGRAGSHPISAVMRMRRADRGES